MDSAFITISSTDAVAEMDVAQRQREERNRNHDKDQVLQANTSNYDLLTYLLPITIGNKHQNFTMMSRSINDSLRRKSGNHTLLPCPPQAN